MRISILYLLTYCVGANLQGQDTLHYQSEGYFDYALIEKKDFFASQRPLLFGNAEVVRKVSLVRKSTPIRHFCSSPKNKNLPFVWHKAQDTLFSLSFFGIRKGGHALINYRQFETRDSIQMAQLTEKDYIKKDVFSVAPLNSYSSSFFHHKPFVEYGVRDSIENTLSFDFHLYNRTVMEFYLRDGDAFYIYNCIIPDDKRQEPKWNEIKVYTSPSFNLDYVPRKYNVHYTGTKNFIKSVKDSLFFNGHFKIIVQGKNKFIINREYAFIYYMSDKEIVKIGSVEVPEDYPAIRGKKLFIEDRDNNEIIFFAPVTWEKNKYPKPKVKVMTEKEMKEKFKYVLQ